MLLSYDQKSSAAELYDEDSSAGDEPLGVLCCPLLFHKGFQSG